MGVGSRQLDTVRGRLGLLGKGSLAWPEATDEFRAAWCSTLRHDVFVEALREKRLESTEAAINLEEPRGSPKPSRFAPSLAQALSIGRSAESAGNFDLSDLSGAQGSKVVAAPSVSGIEFQPVNESLLGLYIPSRSCLETAKQDPLVCSKLATLDDELLGPDGEIEILYVEARISYAPQHAHIGLRSA